MNLIITLVLFVILIDALLVFIIIKSRKGATNKFLELFERLAIKHNGKVIKRFYNMVYYLEIPCDDMMMKLSFSSGGKNSPPKTQCTTKLKASCKGLVVMPENFLTKFGKKIGFQDIQINNPQFDDAFLIKGKEEMIARQLLGYEVQEKFLKHKDWSPVLFIHNSQFSLSASRVLKEEREYDDLIDLSSKLIRKLRQVGIH